MGADSRWGGSTAPHATFRGIRRRRPWPNVRSRMPPLCPGNDPCTVTDPLTGRSDNVTLITPSAKTWYDGLLLGVKRRPTHFDLFGRSSSWGFNVNYTLSKSFDYANDDQIPFREFRQAD